MLRRRVNPCCGYITDAADDLSEGSDDPPSPGDISICLNCGRVLVYLDGPSNRTRLAQAEDIIPLSPRDQRHLIHLQHYIRARGLIHKTVTPWN